MFTRFQTRSHSQRRTQPHAAVVVALVCLALLALLTVAQVAHTHSESSDADHCPLCIVMHTVAPAIVAAAVITLVQIALAAPTPEAHPITRIWHAQLFIRPPPARF